MESISLKEGLCCLIEIAFSMSLSADSGCQVWSMFGDAKNRLFMQMKLQPSESVPLRRRRVNH